MPRRLGCPASEGDLSSSPGRGTAAFVLMMIGNVLTIYVPGLPLWSSLVIAFAARNSAAYFTTWYPQYRKAKYGAPPANALPGTN